MTCKNKLTIIISLLNKRKTKCSKNTLVQGPGYTKKPLGHRVAYPTLYNIYLFLF